MKNLAIIPARGGSKRIPRKNIKPFLGKPIILYSIKTALASGLFDEVMVSTDDEEIAKLAKQNGASVPFMRSKEGASDYATTVEVLIEVVDSYKQQGKSFDNLCCIYPTAPFVTASDLKYGYELLKKGDSSLPVVEFGFPVLRAFVKNGEDGVRYAWPEYEKSRSQDLEKYYHDAGQWYWIKTAAMLGQKTMVTSTARVIEKNRMEVQDIDTEEDWKLAELKYSMLKRD